jgi:hypothetical protein
MEDRVRPDDSKVDVMAVVSVCEERADGVDGWHEEDADDLALLERLVIVLAMQAVGVFFFVFSKDTEVFRRLKTEGGKGRTICWPDWRWWRWRP